MIDWTVIFASVWCNFYFLSFAFCYIGIGEHIGWWETGVAMLHCDDGREFFLHPCLRDHYDWYTVVSLDTNSNNVLSEI